VQSLESVAKFEDIDLLELAERALRVIKGLDYLEFFGEINEHNVARFHLTASGIQANGSDHIDSTALNEVGAGSEFEDLKAFIDGGA
jgi:hypothetical protein